MVKHIPFKYDTCECHECKRNRENKIAEKQRESYLRQRLGPNFKNIMSGLGDQ